MQWGETSQKRRAFNWFLSAFFSLVFFETIYSFGYVPCTKEIKTIHALSSNFPVTSMYNFLPPQFCLMDFISIYHSSFHTYNWYHYDIFWRKKKYNEDLMVFIKTNHFIMLNNDANKYKLTYTVVFYFNALLFQMDSWTVE